MFVDALPIDSGNGDPADLLSTNKKPAALVTHRDNDHFSNAALRIILGEGGRLVTQADTVPLIDTRGLRVQGVAMWEPVFFPAWGADIVAFAVPAVDGFGAPQCSWVIDGGGSRIFHGGDTRWHGRWVDYGRAYGPFDAAFLPINGARINAGRVVDDGIPAVLTPEQAVIAAKRLGARRLVPIHYGQPDPPNYNETDHPLERLKVAAGSLPLTVLQTGEWFAIDPSARPQPAENAPSPVIADKQMSNSPPVDLFVTGLFHPEKSIGVSLAVPSTSFRTPRPATRSGCNEYWMWRRSRSAGQISNHRPAAKSALIKLTEGDSVSKPKNKGVYRNLPKVTVSCG